jgi:hypothetical protein
MRDAQVLAIYVIFLGKSIPGWKGTAFQFINLNISHNYLQGKKVLGQKCLLGVYACHTIKLFENS